MNDRLLKVGAIGMAALLMAGQLRATMVATEQNMAGANVALDQYCSSVASGAVVATPIDNILNLTDKTNKNTNEATTNDDLDDDEEQPEHIKLNLNYSRLGIASKVDTYLNVRKKPNESSEVVGKLIKNAGCHVYSVKKGWAKIVSGKVKGYIKASYMVFDKDAEKLATKVGKNVAVVNTPSLKVRELPTTKAHIYAVVAIEGEFEIKKLNLTKEFVEKVIKKNKISANRVNEAGGLDEVCQSLSNWICIKVDDEYAFVAKDYIKMQYTLKRGVKVGDTISSGGDTTISTSQVSVASYAKQFLGNPYVWGGTSLTHGTDCSGFTQSLYRHFGKSLPRTAAEQCGATRKVSSPQPGDLFFYSNGSRVNHVAMYIGGGLVIHASNPSDGIKISNAFYRTPVKIGRVL